jgi:hypothetical protein
MSPRKTPLLPIANYVFYLHNKITSRTIRISGTLIVIKELSHYTLQRKSHLCIPFLGIARPQTKFPYSCVCERFIYSKDRFTYFPAAEQTDDHGNRSQTHTCGNGTEAPQFLSGNTCFELLVLCLCSVG